MRSPLDPDHGHHDSRTRPEALLVQAIVARAVRDLFGQPGNSVNPGENALIRRDALNFLTARSGAWAQHRKELCDVSGLDSDALARRIIAILEGDDRPLASYDGGAELDCIDDARKLWATRPHPTTATRSQSILPRINVTPPPPEGMTRDEIRSTLFRMLRHGPATSKELSDAMGRAISSRAVTAYLNRDLAVERAGDVWSLKSEDATSALPQLSVDQEAA